MVVENFACTVPLKCYVEYMDQPDSEELGKSSATDDETTTTPEGASEPFRTPPTSKEKTESHIITVRQAARMFEEAGVARTERSIINWCTLNRQGLSRLDCYFDPNEQKYLITPEGLYRAIDEEQVKEKVSRGAEESAVPFGTSPHDGTKDSNSFPSGSESERGVGASQGTPFPKHSEVGPSGLQQQVFEALLGELEEKNRQLTAKDKQLDAKDEQITHLHVFLQRGMLPAPKTLDTEEVAADGQNEEQGGSAHGVSPTQQ